ncbi:hypothetical protein KY290_005332 [Solanum tuberosum]|uniref:Uncharacterized protein n=1 Tax=Solanum tuberosum TaxID=4113 RepID=A0ABQ7WFY6_SOLTU|nr:hypothetical protein KY284_024843 [Solanum tuberosum]KAH0720396.1 hypothetical protein KY284_005426 [Solanum tuberosum]KAH0722674.1 hypothetical protein KY289_005718 [Solanum tuberosum]KAH0752051.1 hypothetical protein KY285_005199 [Solanum tuberosum]KAH0778905.1 hypothetical protein KY290_005332 [Solanum tuberosum]
MLLPLSSSNSRGVVVAGRKREKAKAATALAAVSAHNRCSLRGANAAVIFLPEREATGGTISVLLLLPDGDRLVAWMLADWSYWQRWRFTNGLCAPAEALHCCSLLILQATLARKKDGGERKTERRVKGVWAADLERRGGE